MLSKGAKAKKRVGKSRKRDVANDYVNLDNEMIYDKLMKCIYWKSIDKAILFSKETIHKPGCFCIACNPQRP